MSSSSRLMRLESYGCMRFPKMRTALERLSSKSTRSIKPTLNLYLQTRSTIRRIRSPVAIRSATFGASGLIHAAQAMGLGTTPMIGFDPVGVSREFSLSDNEVPAPLVAVGYPTEANWPQKPRRPVSTCSRSRNSSNQRRSRFPPASSNSREIDCVVKAAGLSRTSARSASIAATDNRQIRDQNMPQLTAILDEISVLSR
jgi:Nitroreductase family